MRKLTFLILLLFLLTNTYAQWEQVGWPTGGEITDLLYVGNDIWAASSGGLYISKDDGQNWEISDLFPIGQTIEDIKIINGDVFVVSTKIQDAPSLLRVEVIYVHRSQDGGVNFTTSTFTRSTPQDYAAIEARCEIMEHGGQLFLTTSPEVFFSTDNGDSWEEHERINRFSSSGDGQLYSEGGTLYYSYMGWANTFYWYYSTDTARTWDNVFFSNGWRVRQPIYAISEDTVIQIENDSLRYTLEVEINWENTLFIEDVDGSGYGLWKNGPGEYLIGTTRGLLLNGLDSVKREINLVGIDSVRSFLETNTGSLLVATKRGLYAYPVGSTDPVDLSSQFRSSFVRNLFISPIGDIFHVRDSALYKSSDQGDTWVLMSKDKIFGKSSELPNGNYQSLHWVNSNPDSFFIGGLYFEYLTTDGGLSFEKFDTEYLYNLVYTEQKNGVLISSGRDTIKYSTNYGENWTLYGTMPDGRFPNSAYNIAYGDHFDLVASNPLEGVYLTRDRGQTWERTPIDRLYNMQIFSLENEILVRTDADWSVTRDTGRTWESFVPVGFVEGNLYSSEVDIFSINDVYFAHVALYGILTSADLKGPWVSLREDLGTRLSTTSCHSKDGVIYLGTENGGIWRYGSTVSRIDGFVYNDVDMDGMYTPQTDTAHQGAVVTSMPSDLSTVSQSDGSFSSLIRTSNDTIRMTSAYPYGVVTPAYHVADTAEAPLVFLVAYEANKDDLVVNVVTGIHRPGFETYLTLIVENQGTTDIPASCYVIAPPGVSLVPVSGTYRVSGDTVFIDFPEIKSHETVTLDFTVMVSRLANLGDELCYVANATFGFGSANLRRADGTPSNNTIEECVIVIGSYDPNDKRVNPSTIDPERLVSDQRLSYTIRFQNTGTYYAEDVEIRDLLSSKLDLSSLRIEAVSHEPYDWSISTGNLVKIRFDNIRLPDSTNNEPESHGFVRFSVLPKGELERGDIITNKAGIYFDFNDPIITNNAEVVVATPEVIPGSGSSSLLSLKLFPNPTSNSVTLELEERVSGRGKVTVLDALGRSLLQGTVTLSEGQGQLDLSILIPGTYQLQVHIDGQTYSGKATVIR